MRCALVALLFIAWPLSADDLGLKVPPNFQRHALGRPHAGERHLHDGAGRQGPRRRVGAGLYADLEDTNGDGKADKATDIAATKTGVMGVCFSISRQSNRRVTLSGDGRLIERVFWTPPSERPETVEDDLITNRWKSGEHGGHAVKIGPDGARFAVAGNDAVLSNPKLADTSPIRSAEGGGIVRIPDLTTVNLRNRRPRLPQPLRLRLHALRRHHHLRQRHRARLPVAVVLADTRLSRAARRPSRLAIDGLHSFARPAGLLPGHGRDARRHGPWVSDGRLLLSAHAVPAALSRRRVPGRLDLRQDLLHAAHSRRQQLQEGEARSLPRIDRHQRLRTNGHPRGAGRLPLHQHRRPRYTRGGVRVEYLWTASSGHSDGRADQ